MPQAELTKMPIVPDLEWIAHQIHDLLSYFRSFAAVHYLSRRFLPMRLRQSWREIMTDEFVQSLLSYANLELPDAGHYRRLAYAILQWRPLVLNFKASMQYMAHYVQIGKRLFRHPERQHRYLKSIQGGFERIRADILDAAAAIGRSPLELFFPGFARSDISISHILDDFLRVNTPRYLAGGATTLAELKNIGSMAPHFSLKHFKAVLPYLQAHQNLEVVDATEIAIARRPRAGFSFMFPVVDADRFQYHIVLIPRTGPKLASNGLHELGHAIHYKNMPLHTSFLDRFVGDNFLTEAVAKTLEALALEPQFYQDVYQLPARVARQMATACRREAQYTAQKHAMDLKFRIELFSRDWTICEAQEAYHRYLQEFLGINTVAVNNFHIAFRPFLPGDYFLADFYSSHILAQLRDVAGEMWWRDARAGGWLRDHWFHFGLSNPLPYPEWFAK